MTGPFEETNEACAIAKIAAIRMCRHYNEQYGTHFISLMPTNRKRSQGTVKIVIHENYVSLSERFYREYGLMEWEKPYPR
jgi:hypothetical protein